MDELARENVSDQTAEHGSSMEGERDSGRSMLDRRAYLKLGAAAAGVVAVGSRAGRAATTGRHGIDFDRVLNAVEDLGMDPDGNEPIDDALYGAMENGTLIEFPPGQYLFEDYTLQRGLRRFGVRGLGAHRNDVEFITPPGRSSYFLFVRGGSDILLENVTFQQRARKDAGDIGNVIVIEDNLQVHDIEFAGFNSSGSADRWALLPKLTDPDGEGLITGFVHTGPSDFKPHGINDGAGGVFEGHNGKLIYRNCHIENAAGDGGLYTGKHEGSTNFENCFFKNNDMCVMRMGAGSYIRDSTIVLDWDDAHPENTGDVGGVNGLYFSSGQFGKSGGGIYNCDIITRKQDGNNDALGSVFINASDGDVTIKDTRIQNDVDGQAAIYAWAPGERFSSHGTPPESDWGLTLENVSITGSGRSTKGAVFLDTRPETVIRDCCIQMENDDGIHLRESPDCVVENTTINVPGKAIDYTRSSADTSGLQYGESCPVPSETWRRADEDEPTDSEGTDDGDADDGDLVDDGSTHHLKLHSTEKAPYRFTVSGDLEFDPRWGTEDYIEGDSARGFLVGGTDAYYFTGVVTDFELDGDATIELDGGAVTPEELRSMGESGSGGSDSDDDSTDDGPDATTRRLRIEGGSGDDVASYTVSADGTFDSPETLNAEDSISDDGSTVSGTVAGYRDIFDFTGDIVAIDIDANATAYVEGRPVDPASVGDADDDGSDDSGSDDSGDGSSGDSDGSEDSNDDSGSDGSEDSEPVEHHLKLYSPEKSRYDLTVTGDLRFDTRWGSEDHLDGNSTWGVLAGGTDAYYFTGSVTEFDIEGDATIELDGKVVTAEDVRAITDETEEPDAPESGDDDGSNDSDGSDGDSGSDGSEDSNDESDGSEDSEPVEHHLKLYSPEKSRYDLTVTGDLRFDTRWGSEDHLDGNSTWGVLAGGTDAYYFTGSVTEFDVEGDATIELDGATVTPDVVRSVTDETESGGDDESDADTDDDYPHSIAIVGLDTVASYEFTVGGDVAPDTDTGTFDAGDNVSGSSAEGAVSVGTDAYLFSGSVTDFQLDGPAAVYVDGQQVDPDLLATKGLAGAALTHTFVVDGTDSDPCSYDLTVDGLVVKHPWGSDDAATDVVEGTSVSGRVDGGVDAYHFRGDLTELAMDGTAQLSFTE
ncbi:hypothetical protein [Halomarina ordinaria]|uniref:Right handed beta helix domain-containing protein n=1 Tax=Halomarina ordinaria TaxID=3033939 RepID=A0ABD5UE07_9EURY|nr:hypothetical protein [Halomarina sp. PSRA2]